MRCDEVDRIIPEREDNITRHWVFARYVLGENLFDAFMIAHRCRRDPLPLYAMEHIAANWNEEPASLKGTP